MTRIDSTAIVAPVCLLLGGVGGALATHHLVGPAVDAVDTGRSALGPSANVSPEVAAEQPPARATRPGVARDAAPGSVGRALPPSADERRPVAVDQGPAEPQGPTAEELGAADDLVAELTALLRSGRVEQSVGTERTRLIDALIDGYLTVRDPTAAYAVLQRVETHAGNWHYVSQKLREAGQAALADQALAQAVRLGLEGGAGSASVPMDVWQVFRRYQVDVDEWIDELRRTAPDLAADLLSERAAAGELTAAMQLDLVRSLTQAGRAEEALAELELILAAGDASIGALQALRELDPERAEVELERRLASSPSAEVELEYFRLLAADDRLDEALALIAPTSADGVLPAHLLREAMRELDPALVREHVDRWVATASGNATVQTEAARFYTRVGDFEAAANSYLDLYEVAASGRGERVPLMPESVAQVAAGAFRGALDRMTAHAGTDDEYWGDIADGYWRIGDREAARRCWERAAAIDPGDGEWSGKLNAVINGTDPL